MRMSPNFRVVLWDLRVERRWERGIEVCEKGSWGMLLFSAQVA